MAFLILLAILSISHADARLYFLNQPESVRNGGELAQFDVPKDELARVFFHYRNASAIVCTFELVAPNTQVEHLGTATAAAPGEAGAAAVFEFFTHSANHEELQINIEVLPWQTISGIVEFTTTLETRVIARLRPVNHTEALLAVDNPRVVTNDATERIIDIALSESLQILRYGHDGPKDNVGQFGITHKIRAQNATANTQRVILSVSPRGGRAILVYSINSVTKTTAWIPARHTQRLAAFNLAPGQTLEVVTMPAGGMSYPMELQFKSQPIQISEK